MRKRKLPLGDEFKLNQPADYEIGERTEMALDGYMHQTIYYSPIDRYGYLINKRSVDDNSYYAPYIFSKVGEKAQIKVPHTELVLANVINPGKLFYMDSFGEHTAVFYDFGYYTGRNLSYTNFDTYFYIYLEDVPYRAKELNGGETLQYSKYDNKKLTVDQYIDAVLYTLTKKQKLGENTTQEQDVAEVKQALVDRIMLNLRLGGSHETSLIGTDRYSGNRWLAPAYFSGSDMLFLGARKDHPEDPENDFILGYGEPIPRSPKAEQLFEMTDEELNDYMNTSLDYRTQFATEENRDNPGYEEVAAYMFKKYPTETNNAYSRIMSFKTQDMFDLLSSLTNMDNIHKKLALRAFDLRGRTLEKVYNEQVKDKTISER